MRGMKHTMAQKGKFGLIIASQAIPLWRGQHQVPLDKVHFNVRSPLCLHGRKL